MKKLLTALGVAAVIATMTMPVSAEKLWKYSETVTIDLAEARYKPTTDGHDILEFVAVEQLPDGTCTYTYVYDRTAGTIQVKEMEKTTKKLHYKSNATSASHLNIKRNCIIYLCLHIFIHIEATDKSIST